MLGLAIDFCKYFFGTGKLPVLCCCNPNNLKGFLRVAFAKDMYACDFYRLRVWRAGWRFGLAYELTGLMPLTAGMAVRQPTNAELLKFAKRKGKKKPKWFKK